MLDDVRNEAWPTACAEVANALQKPPFCYDAYRQILQRAGVRFYHGGLKSYNSTHLLRSLAFATRSRFEDHLGDWDALSNMGNGVKQYELDYDTAVQMVDSVRRSGVPEYSLGDLACYLCLAKAHAA
ncbi:unnamed protein product [Prorocentrum cordatum]|uniref:Uncharacterized protein n=1 Tax=Prorocentrum cordatum TaxID=2364126 RepID=A0ABN9VKR2_9DINO|nr:unnamed protein product [Polarella glacialis]